MRCYVESIAEDQRNLHATGVGAFLLAQPCIRAATTMVTGHHWTIPEDSGQQRLYLSTILNSS